MNIEIKVQIPFSEVKSKFKTDKDENLPERVKKFFDKKLGTDLFIYSVDLSTGTTVKPESYFEIKLINR